MEETIMFVYVATGILTGIYFIFNEIKKETDDFTKSIYPADATECLIIGTGSGLFWPIVIAIAILHYFVNIVVKNKRKNTIKAFNLTARNSPTSKVAGCKGFGLVQGLAPCA